MDDAVAKGKSDNHIDEYVTKNIDVAIKEGWVKIY